MARETINGISVPIPGTGEPADFVGDLRQIAEYVHEAIMGRPALRVAVGQTLRAAYDFMAALYPSGGFNLIVPEGRFVSGTWNSTDYLDLPDVAIIGAKMPRPSANCDRLEGGTVIEGTFSAFAHGLTVMDIGFDLGKYVCDTYSLGDLATPPPSGDWTAFAMFQPDQVSPLPERRGCSVRNVIGLTRDSNTYGHALLIEGADGAVVDNVVGIGAIHGAVIKSKNTKVGLIAGYSASSNHVIIKADSYANGSGTTVDQVIAERVYPGTTPWFTPAVVQSAINLNAATATLSALQIGQAKVGGSAARGLHFSGGQPTADIQIGTLLVDGQTFAAITDGIAMDPVGARFRITIDSYVGNNCAEAVYIGDGSIRFGRLVGTNLGARLANLAGYARLFADQVHAEAVPNAYYLEDNARIIIGAETLASVPVRWERNPPALLNDWGPTFGSGNSSFEVYPEGYEMKAKGLLSASLATANEIASLPVYLRPSKGNQRFPTVNGNGASVGLVVVGTGIDCAARPTDYLTLDGIGWRHY